MVGIYFYVLRMKQMKEVGGLRGGKGYRGMRVPRLAILIPKYYTVVVVVALLFYVHGKHLRSCRDGQLT